MNNLIIDAATDKILFKVIAENKSYTSEFPNDRENFDKFAQLLFRFLQKNNIRIGDIKNIFINQGPGKFSGIRTSIAIAKAISINNDLDLYGFSSNQVLGKNYTEILDLYRDGMLKKNLIKPIYSS
tara:strand:- start:4898 stop:5275 length:378 start_codon:yes stop_codon:yes gene_type:complete